MAKKKIKVKKVTTVRSHPRHVPMSDAHPDGITTVRQHPRHFHGVLITGDELKTIADQYDRSKLIYPTSDNLNRTNGNTYDELIAIWVDYFNRKFSTSPPNALLDPNVVKALIGSESDFNPLADNRQAFGIAQITKATLKALQDQEGEAKEYVFKGIRQKDLKDPEIAIPLAVRWLFRKRQTARSRLKRNPSAEELILEYKGLQASNTQYSENAVKRFREFYAKLKVK